MSDSNRPGPSPQQGADRTGGFLILCLGRTGSTHLAALLDSHPEIRCYGEVLNMTHPKAAPEGWFGNSDEADPVAHVRSLLASDEPILSGAKLPINSLQDHPGVVEWLRRDPIPAVIRLKRRNSLALLVSRRLLRATLVSQSTDGGYGDARITIDPEECLRALGRIEREDALLDDLAAGHPVFELSYEELVAGERLGELQRFLGVQPAELRSGYERLRRRPLAETIVNWDELAARLRRSRYAPLLAESAGNE